MGSSDESLRSPSGTITKQEISRNRYTYIICENVLIYDILSHLITLLSKILITEILSGVGADCPLGEKKVKNL
jgi:hypothetical protein